MYILENMKALVNLPVLTCFLLLVITPLALSYRYLFRLKTHSYQIPVHPHKMLYGILIGLVISNSAAFSLDRYLGSDSAFSNHPMLVLFLLFLIDLPFLFLLFDSFAIYHASKRNTQVDIADEITQHLQQHRANPVFAADSETLPFPRGNI
ncbi:hypothetical protein [Ktedonospora formicarum]|uniref:Uncharacterized protein n=1 Tax=Ktedonospora formicarum TaxID=2778364 RepID=A0A8J3I5Q6_9CHLR|nr:hypothetical protein [Ktedonospora formicarum]GHO46383.1 hypothetical protein KSX_45460 [Ktedonospora formicarum]